MKPLSVLLITFIISLLIFRFTNSNYAYQISGRIAMPVMLVFTSIGHFEFVRGMAMMVPGIFPYKKLIVYATGIMEILAAIGLLLTDFKMTTAWFLIALFVLMLPANINAALQHINYEKGTYQGNGPNYLWFSVPLQVFFIVWVYYSAIYIH